VKNVPKEHVSKEVAQQRQEEMKRSGLAKFLIGICLLFGGFGSWCIPTSNFMGVLLVGAFLMIFGLILAYMGWGEYQDARRVQRDMYLRGQ
jgi:hypothetical protein